MKTDKAPTPIDLASWIDALQSRGVYHFTRDDAIKSLKATDMGFRKASGRLAKKSRIVRVRGGFFVIVPLEYAAGGILPAEWFIDDLMKYVGQPYYVGLLNAANFHGAAHQQPQQFQVVTTKPLREIRLKGLTIRFFVKKRFHDTPTTRMKTQTGYIPVATPEATALDLIRYARSIGGTDRVLTVLHELGETMQSDRLVEAAKAEDNLTYVQRLGWLLEKAGFPGITEGLAEYVNKRKPLPAKLEPSLPVKGSKRDARWGLIINSEVESDF